MSNPFEFGRELGSEELVNRTDELETVRNTIEAGGKLFIIGPRRYGKTSILKTAAERAEKNGSIVFRYNAEGFPDLGQLVSRIIEDSGKKLKGKIENTGEKLRKYFRSLRPEISFGFSQNEWKVTLGGTPSSSTGQVGLLVDALNGLEELAADQPKGRSVALILDEFQEIIEAGVTAEKQIRSAIQTHKRTAYIFAGSETRMLTEMTTDAGRPFYRLGKLLFIGDLPRPEFARFLIDNFVRGGFLPISGVDEEKRRVADLILDLSEDVPYNVQMLAHTLWDRLSQIQIATPDKAILTREIVEETLEAVIRRNDPFYTQFWNGLTAIQKKCLHAVVVEKGERLQSLSVVKSTGVSPSSMRKSIDSLIGRDILRPVETRGTVRFRFEDPFFAHWIKIFTF
ncbi:MAG: ATP-binding protein [Pyrinomonadaceae bacterium]